MSSIFLYTGILALNINLMVASNSNLDNFRILWKQAEIEKVNNKTEEALNIYKVIDSVLLHESDEKIKTCVSLINNSFKSNLYSIKPIDVEGLKCTFNFALH